jgi:hypothetical protein
MSNQEADGPTAPESGTALGEGQAKPYEAPTLAVLGMLEVVAGGSGTRSDGGARRV